MGDSLKEIITVVVPVRNRPRLVVRCLESIKAQTYRPIRVVVVDDGSTDDTRTAVENWIACNREDGFTADLICEPAAGPSAARNAGVREVDSRLMMHFDSDDTMRPGHIESVMRRFAADDYPDLVCFRVVDHLVDGREKTTKHPGSRLMENHLVHSVLRTLGYACETALLRRAGGWKENLHGWEDFELGVRLILESRKRAFIPDINVDVFCRRDSVTGEEFSSKAGNWETALEEIEKDLESSLNRNRRRWRRYVDYRRAILAAFYRREGRGDLARSLMDRIEASQDLTALQKAYLKGVYSYTARGGRGAYIPARFLF